MREPFMDDLRQTGDSIFRDRILRARQMSAASKLAAGYELFEFACGVSRAGIKHQNPGASDAEVERMLRERLALQSRLEVGQWKLKK